MYICMRTPIENEQIHYGRFLQQVVCVGPRSIRLHFPDKLWRDCDSADVDVLAPKQQMRQKDFSDRVGIYAGQEPRSSRC